MVLRATLDDTDALLPLWVFSHLPFHHKRTGGSSVPTRQRPVAFSMWVINLIIASINLIIPAD